MADTPTPSLPTARSRTLLDTVPGLKQLLLLVGIAGAVAAAIWLVLWSQSSGYTLLYGQLGERETGQVVDALTAAGIPNKLEGGSVLVPESKVHEARIKLAGQGLPQSSGNMGVELIEKDQGFGTSQFMEKARYQHALETELGRTIASVQGVQSARVHLAIPPPSVFVRDRERPSASVMLQLYAGRRLDPGQVAAVVHLVASSVPDLAANQVTVVDQNGTLLNSPGDNDDMAVSARQFEYTRQLEQSYSHRVVDLLEPLLGPNRVHAQVTADLDFTVTEQTSEDYDPAKTAVRSEQTASDQRMSGDSAQGVPGALSNQPPGTSGLPQAQQPAGAAGANAATANKQEPVSTSSRSTRNFEVDRVIRHTREPSGVLRKLSVAVLVDDWQKVGDDGTVTKKPLTDVEIERLSKLVKQAIGFDEKRGDQVNVMNASFNVAPPLPEPEAQPLLERPWLKTVLKQGVAAVLVLLLIFVILKPIISTLTQPVRGGGPGGDQANFGGMPGQMMFGPNYEQQLAAARGLVGQDPKRAAEVMKEWVSGNG